MKIIGGRKQTEDFFRLFLVPGVHHCGGGPGLTEFDALENWVEKGQAPEKLIASRLSNGVVERSRPVFPNSKQDAERYHREQYPKIQEMLKDLLETAPVIRTFDVHTSTTHRIAPGKAA